MENNNFNNNNNLMNDYPYGELPLKYTKQGQEQIRQDLKNKHNAPAYYNNANIQSLNSVNYNNQSVFPNQNFSNSYINNNNNINQNAQNNQNVNTQSADNASDNSGSNGSGLDMKSLLPLLGSVGGGGEQMESFKQLMPLLNGGGQMDMNTLLKLFGGMNKKKPASTSNNVKTDSTTTKSESKIKIDNLKRVDD